MNQFQLHHLNLPAQSVNRMFTAARILFVMICCVTASFCTAQNEQKTRNVFIITTDGFRWEELFKGADSSLITNPDYVKDSSLTREMFWDSTIVLRRKKLMPFFWNVIAKQGQIHGNRSYNNKVDVKNFYKISYPGYNEILTGYADWKPMLNFAIQNKNTNVLEYLNTQPAFHGKIVAFSSWNIMPYVFNEKRSDFLINSGSVPK